MGREKKSLRGSHDDAEQRAGRTCFAQSHLLYTLCCSATVLYAGQLQGLESQAGSIRPLGLKAALNMCTGAFFPALHTPVDTFSPSFSGTPQLQHSQLTWELDPSRQLGIPWTSHTDTHGPATPTPCPNGQGSPVLKTRADPGKALRPSKRDPVQGLSSF